MNQMVDKPEPSLGHITALGQISVSAIRLVLIIGSGRAGSPVGRKASFKEILHQQHATTWKHVLKYKSEKFIRCSLYFG